MQFSHLNCRLKDVISAALVAGNNLPCNGDGTHMCLSYHVKGKCNMGCGCVTDHRQCTAEEDNALNVWCTANYHTTA